MQKLKRYLTRPVCLTLALVILAASMTVAALNGSPYDTLKDAAFNLIQLKNATIAYDLTVTVDGVGQEQTSGTTAFAENARLSAEDNWKQFANEKYNLHVSRVGNGEPDQYRLSIYKENQSVGSASLFGSLSEYSRSDMYVRLGELLLDLMVGDLKNNIASSGYDDGKTLAMTLTAQQIPEIYNALLTVAVAEGSGHSGSRTDYDETTMECTQMSFDIQTMTKVVTVYPFIRQYYDPATGEPVDADDPRAEEGNYYTQIEWDKPITAKTKVTPLTMADFGEDKMDQPFKEAVIDYAGFTARVDKNDYFVDGRGEIRIKLTTIFGETFIAEMVLNASCTDIGTTAPQPFVSGIDEIFTDEFVQAFVEAQEETEKSYYGSSSFTFTLNDDGTIDESSIVFNGYNGPMVRDAGTGRIVSYPEPVLDIAVVGGADGPTSVAVQKE